MRAFMSSGSGELSGWRYAVRNPEETHLTALDEALHVIGQVEGSAAVVLSTSRPNTARFDSPAIVLGRVEGGPRTITAGAILAESLAAVTADGGPLDELSWQAFVHATDSSWMMSDAAVACSLAYLHNSQAQADPVILAAQRDIAVLSAYAQGVRA